MAATAGPSQRRQRQGPGDEDAAPLFESNVYVSPLIAQVHYPAVAAALQAFIDEQARSIDEKGQTYVWYREPLSVAVVRNKEGGAGDDDDAVHIRATMRHGGSVEDEWLAVHLLLLATQSATFSEAGLLSTLHEHSRSDDDHPSVPGIIADIKDEDGQFLLIEAADSLPSWLQPRNSEGRVWISGGQVHLIPPQAHAGDVDAEDDGDFQSSGEGRPLKPRTALDILRKNPATFSSPALLQAVIKQRLPSYPSLSWACDTQHSTLVFLPMVAAKIVNRYPQVIADAAESFQARDGPAVARILRDMSTFVPPVAPTNDVQSFLVPIKLPRRMYALLLAEKYFPPKAFGARWRESVMNFWESLEDPKAAEGKREGNEEGRRRDLGAKLTCGLELLLSQTKDRLRSNPANLFDTNEDGIRQSLEYKKFIESLSSMGYFGQEIRDSYAWKQRERQAIKLWRQSMTESKDEANEYTSDRLAFFPPAVQSCWRDRSFPVHVDPAQGEKALALLEDPEGFLYDDDNDDGTAGEGKKDAEAVRLATEQIHAFSTKLQSFVEGQGDTEGALFDDDEMEEGGDTDDEEEDAVEEAHKRLTQMTDEEKSHAYANLIPGVPAQEWGAKAAKEAKEAPQQGDRASERSAKMNVDEEIRTEGVRSAAAATSTSATQSPNRIAGFSRAVQYDGASDSDESVDDDVLRAGDTDLDRLNRAQALDIESYMREDEERRRMIREDGDEAAAEGDDGDWHDEPDSENELGEDDLLGFIEFTRKELGLSEEQFDDILQKRKERGAYVPHFKSAKHRSDGKASRATTFKDAKGKAKATELSDDVDADEGDHGRTFRQQTRENERRAYANTRTTEAEKEAARVRAQGALDRAEEQDSLRRREERAGKQPPQDAFTRLMDAMDQELRKHKGEAAAPNVHAYDGSDDDDNDDDMMDALSAQDAELLDKMLHSGPPASLQALLRKQTENPLGLSEIERQVMDGMLQSYQAQMGNAGPVSGLMGRFGVRQLPRHSDEK